MTIKLSEEELRSVATVIGTEGFRTIEALIRWQLEAQQNTENITGDPFRDGILKGESRGRKQDLLLFKTLKDMIAEREKNGAGN